MGRAVAEVTKGSSCKASKSELGGVVTISSADMGHRTEPKLGKGKASGEGCKNKVRANNPKYTLRKASVGPLTLKKYEAVLLTQFLEGEDLSRVNGVTAAVIFHFPGTKGLGLPAKIQGAHPIRSNFFVEPSSYAHGKNGDCAMSSAQFFLVPEAIRAF